jgi:hypothetical protein
MKKTMIVDETIKTEGFIQAIIDYESGEREIIEFKNTVLTKGREALASCLARNIGDGFNFYINRMIFGDGGTAASTTKYISTGRNGLFGITQVSKPVIASIDPNIPSQVIFTSVISRAEANGAVLNEMALQMANGDLYSMRTFKDLTKTAQMQITWNWRLTFV